MAIERATSHPSLTVAGARQVSTFQPFGFTIKTFSVKQNLASSFFPFQDSRDSGSRLDVCLIATLL
jgi:hypothetical protein